MLLQKSKENFITILAFKAKLRFAVGRLMGTGSLWPRYLNATYLEPFDVAVQLPTASRRWLPGAALIYQNCRNKERPGKDETGIVPLHWLSSVNPAPA